MAENTLGRKLKDGEKTRVASLVRPTMCGPMSRSIDGYSAHADQQELLAWVDPIDRKRLQQLFVVHGEPAAADTLLRLLRERGFAQVTIPERTDSHLNFDRCNSDEL